MAKKRLIGDGFDFTTAKPPRGKLAEGPSDAWGPDEIPTGNGDDPICIKWPVGEFLLEQIKDKLETPQPAYERETAFENVDTCACYWKRTTYWTCGKTPTVAWVDDRDNAVDAEEIAIMGGSIRRKGQTFEPKTPFEAQVIAVPIDADGTDQTAEQLIDAAIAAAVRAPEFTINGVTAAATSADVFSYQIETRDLCDKNGDPLQTEAGANITNDCFTKDGEDGLDYAGDDVSGGIDLAAVYNMATEGTYLVTVCFRRELDKRAIANFTG